MNKKLLILSLIILSSSNLLFPSRRRRRRGRRRQTRLQSDASAVRQERKKIRQDFETAFKMFGVGKIREAIEIFTKLAKNPKRPDIQDKSLCNLAKIYDNQGDLTRSFKYADKVLRQAEYKQHIRPKDIAEINYIVGKITKDPARATRRLLKALNVFERHPKEFTDKIVRSHYIIGINTSIKADDLVEEEGENRDEEISRLRSEARDHFEKILEFEDAGLNYSSLRMKISSAKELGYIHKKSDSDLLIFYLEKELELIKSNKRRITRNVSPEEYNKLYHNTLFVIMEAMYPKLKSIEEEGEENGEIEKKLGKYVQEWVKNGCDKKTCDSCKLYANKTCSCQEAKYCSAKCQKIDWPEHKETCSAQRDEEEGEEEETLPELVDRHYCSVCSEHSTLQCSRCKKAWYCSRECQRANWPEHKSECSQLSLSNILDTMRDLGLSEKRLNQDMSKLAQAFGSGE